MKEVQSYKSEIYRYNAEATTAAAQTDKVQQQGARHFIHFALTSFCSLFPTISLFDHRVSYLPNTYWVPAVDEYSASVPRLRFSTPSTRLRWDSDMVGIHRSARTPANESSRRRPSITSTNLRHTTHAQMPGTIHVRQGRIYEDAQGDHRRAWLRSLWRRPKLKVRLSHILT
jgi:hypothetical protein